VVPAAGWAQLTVKASPFLPIIVLKPVLGTGCGCCFGVSPSPGQLWKVPLVCLPPNLPPPFGKQRAEAPRPRGPRRSRGRLGCPPASHAATVAQGCWEGASAAEAITAIRPGLWVGNKGLGPAARCTCWGSNGAKRVVKEQGDGKMAHQPQVGGPEACTPRGTSCCLPQP